MHEKQVSEIINMSLLTFYTEEKEHASTSCFGMWRAQRHITAADTLRSVLTLLRAVLGLVARFKEDVLAPLRHIELAKLAQRRVAANVI